MGSRQSKEAKREAAILRQPKKGEASKFYWACRNGDIETVRQILSQSDYNEINRLEPNGSTALHAAVYYGRTEVVRILLREYGVERHRRNLHNLTAFEEAADDEIRLLFMRLGTDRFCSRTNDECADLFAAQTKKDPAGNDDQDEIPNDTWIAGTENEADTQFHQWVTGVMTVMLSSKILRAILLRCMRMLAGDSGKFVSFSGCTTLLKEFFNQHVPSNTLDYPKAQQLFEDCESEKKIYPLLKIYTLETPFVRKLASEGTSIFLWFAILLRLSTTTELAYEGISYRGLTLSEKDLQAYQWAQRHKGSTLVMKTFSSTSAKRQVAENFAQSDDLIRVIMEFNFIESCPTALMLYKKLEKHEPISDYPNEYEILVMPFTMFRVTNIDKDDTDRYVIHLECVPAKIDGDFSALYNGDATALIEAAKNFIRMHTKDE
ncbi:unnamed protein product [Rotaria sp. Silwood1]|nr:unnamed protein product [Rotaria sp. Silwood1]CAF1654360.1 unnamed protein product [Rotaria sp. Silwood1]CAF3845314.1 unnamed protein product [Rotaria sp. Silwood1]CAF4034161.1 unnamed protein product [Rotaria sp. Silwood1]